MSLLLLLASENAATGAQVSKNTSIMTSRVSGASVGDVYGRARCEDVRGTHTRGTSVLRSRGMDYLGKVRHGKRKKAD